MAIERREMWVFEVTAFGDVEKAVTLTGRMPSCLPRDGRTEPYRCVVVRCDGCGEYLRDGDIGGVMQFDDVDEARRELRDYEWTTDGDGLDHCWTCVRHPDAPTVPVRELRLVEDGA